MKQFVFGFCAVLVLTFGSVRVASAQDWWRHTGPGPMGAGADKHIQWPKPKVTFREAHANLHLSQVGRLVAQKSWPRGRGLGPLMDKWGTTLEAI